MPNVGTVLFDFYFFKMRTYVVHLSGKNYV